MLRGLRKASSNWLGKVVMIAVVGFLVISFAIWGIGDIFRGFGRSTFAKIGSTEVTIEQFRQIYNDRLQQLSRRLGQPLSMEQARARGYDRAIIGEFIAQIVLDERAKALRLGITDAEISKRITGNPAFQAVNGQFDRARFSDIIRQMGYTELRRAYEERRARFVTPEKRNIQQIVFTTSEEATAAAERIAKGATFAEIATERGQTEKDIDLGLITKGAIIDRSIADAAFALKEGEVSAPVQGRFGTALLRVVKIEPEHVRSFEEVTDELKQTLATERAKGDMLSVYDKIEDERSLGKTLAEAAEKLKLPVRTIEIDRAGRDLAGNEVPDLPEAQRLLAGAFTAEVGVEVDPLQVEGG